MKKRIIAMILCITMLTTIVPPFASPAGAAADRILLPVMKAKIDIADGDSYAVMGTASTAVKNSGRYIATVYRKGDMSSPASVALKTIDISAGYGEDYKIDDSKYKTEVFKQEKNLLELAAENLGVGANEPVENFQEMMERTAQGQKNADTPKSKLAEKRENSLGKESREVSAPNADMNLFEAIGADPGKDMPVSSSTLIEFDKGEKVKRITFETFQSKEAQGDKSFDLVLSDPSDPLKLSAVVNCSITIKDNRKEARSVISLSGVSDTKAGVVAKITRKGAPHSVATVMVNAVREDGRRGKETRVEFQPYVTERSVTLDIPKKAKTISVDLYGFMGADRGEVIKKKFKPSYASEGYQPVRAAAAASSDEWGNPESVTVRNTEYEITAHPDKGDGWGLLVSNGRNWGEYYFAEKNAWDKQTGGSPQASGAYHHTNSKANKHEKSDGCASKNGGQQHWLLYFNGKWGADGSNITLYPSNITMDNFKYGVFDWSLNANSSGANTVEYYVNSKTSYKITSADSFDKKISNPLLLRDSDSGKRLTGMKRIYVKLKQDGNVRNPIMGLQVFGMALMYRTFNVSVEQPDEMTYQRADGTTQSIRPAQFRLANTKNSSLEVPAEETIDFNSEPYDYAGSKMIRGYLDQYQITVKDTSGKDHSFTVDAEKMSLTFDSDFTKKIHDAAGAVPDGADDSISVKIKPIYKHIDVQVTIQSDSHGKFKDSRLSAGTHTFHAGDMFHLEPEATQDGWYPAAYRLVQRNLTGSPVRDSSNYDFSITETLQEGSYTIRPEFSDANCIEIKMSEDARSKLQVQGLISDSKLSDDLKGKMIIADKANIDELHQISVVPVNKDGKTYRARFSLVGEDKKINGYQLDFLARGRRDENVVTIEAEEINPADYRYFEYSGSLYYIDSAIRYGANKIEPETVPAGRVTVTANSYIATGVKENNPVRYVARYSADSEDDGKFTVAGIKAVPGDVISVLIDNGYTKTPRYVTLLGEGTPKEREFTEQEVDPDTFEVTDKQVTAPCYLFSAGGIQVMQESSNTVRCEWISYEYESNINNTLHGNSKDTVSLVGGKLNVTLEVSFNSSDQGVKRVKYYTKNDEMQTLQAETEASAKGQTVFTTQLDLEDKIRSGDLLYVELVDANDREITTTLYDDEGNETGTQTTSVESSFPMRYTGLRFVADYKEPVHAQFGQEGESETSVPLLDGLNISSNYFDLKLTRRTGSNVDENGYTIEHPDYTDNVDFGYQYPKMPRSLQLLEGVKAKMNEGREQDRKEYSAIDELADFLAEQGVLSEEEVKEMKGTTDDVDKDSLNNMFKEPMIRWSITLGFGFDWKWDPDQKKYVFAGGSYLVGGSFSIGKTFYTVIYGIPCYLNLTGTVEAKFTGNYRSHQGDDSEDDVADIAADDLVEDYNVLEMYNPNSSFQATVSGKVTVGVGICNILGARGFASIIVYGRVALGDATRTANKQAGIKNDGMYFLFEGGFGLDLAVFSIEYSFKIPLGGIGVYAGVKPEDVTAKSRMQAAGPSEVSAALRTYKATKSKWVADTPAARAVPEPVGYHILEENAAERAKPQIAVLPDGEKLMVFLDNDGSHTVNGTRVMAAVCDKKGVWGKPEQISKSGYTAAYPKLHKSKDGSVYISWSEASKIFGAVPEDEKEKIGYASEVLKSLDIKYTSYTSGNGFGSVQSLTDEASSEEQYMDINPEINFNPDGDELIAYYMKRDIGQVQANLSGDDTEEKLAQLAGLDTTYTTMCFKGFNGTKWEEERFVDVKVPGANDPLIIDFTVFTKEINQEPVSIYAFTYDSDNNLETSEDRDVYIGAYDITEDKAWDAAAITDSYHAETVPKLNVLGGDLQLTWATDANTINRMNIDENLITQPEGDEEPEAEESLDNLFRNIKEDTGVGFNSHRYDVDGERQLSGLADHIILHGDDGNDYIFWTDEAYDEENSGGKELYGAVYVNDGGEDGADESGFSDAVKITKFNENTPGLILDEIDVDLSGNGGMTMVSNMYTQSWDGENVEYSSNKLISVDFVPRNSLGIENLSFDKTYPNDDTEVSFQIKNNGLAAGKGYEVSVSNGSDVLETVSSGEHILPGKTKEFSFPVTVKDTDKIVVTVKENGTSDEVREELPVLSGSELTFSGFTAAAQSLTGALMSGKITNNGNQTSDAFEAEVIRSTQDENFTLGTIKIPRIEPGQTKEIQENIKIDLDDLDRFASMTFGLNLPDTVESLGSTICDLTVRRPVDIVIGNNSNQISMKPGESMKLNGAAQPERFFKASLLYSVEDDSIAVVNSEGELTAVNPGRTNIEVVYPDTGLSKTLPLTVTKGNPVRPSASSSPAARTAAKPKAGKKAGTYTKRVKVKLSSKTSGAKIHYTTNGKKPTTKSKSVKNGKTVTIKKTSVLKFMAAAKGYKNSSVVSGKYTIKTAKPKVPKSKLVKRGTKINLKAARGVTLYYTTNGKRPNKKSKTKVRPRKRKKIRITKTTTLRIMAMKKGCKGSPVVKRTYRIRKKK